MALKVRLTESGLRPIEVAILPKVNSFFCFFSFWPGGWKMGRLTESGLWPIEVASYPKVILSFASFLSGRRAEI